MYKEARHVQNIIIGAGPAGVQLGYFFQKAGIEYLILEKAEKAGSFFDKYPHSGKLISINKKYTGSDIPDFNLRHDWNSLLSDDGPKFTEYSEDFYPDSKDLTRYINDFSNKYSLKINYNTNVEKIRQSDMNGYSLNVSDPEGKWIYTCEKLIVATGLGIPDYSNIVDTTNSIKHYSEYEKDYFKNPVNLAKYNGKKILIIGGGNSSYELANMLTPHCGTIIILGRNPKELAMFSHYAGDLRSTYLGFHDTFLLKSLNAFENVKDDYTKIIRLVNHGSRYKLLFICCDKCKNKRNYSTNPDDGWDEIILCTGWKFDTSIFDFMLPMKEKYPMTNKKYESISHKNLFFIGSLMHVHDHKKSSGGFIHGFRYLIKYFFHQNYDGNLAIQKFDIQSQNSFESLVTFIMSRINTASSLYQMFGQLFDLFIYTRDTGSIIYINDVDLQFLQTKTIDTTRIYFMLSLEYGKVKKSNIANIRDMKMLGEKISSIGSESDSTLIHPILRVLKDSPEKNNKVLIDEIHFDEDILADFSSPLKYRDKLIRTLKMFI
jgi:thioredoxin reductase